MNLSREEAFRSWAKILKPESLRTNLIVASLFLAGYEMLQASVVDQIRSFFISGFNENGEIISERYKNDVLCLDKSPFRASLLWLKAFSAIDDTDIKLIDDIRKHRNELAHELPKFLGSVDSDINITLLERIYYLMTKIDRWWIKEVEIPINPDFDGQDIVDSEIFSGSMLIFQIMIKVATGEDFSMLWEEFQKGGN